MSIQVIKEQLDKIYEESNLREDGCPLVEACKNSCTWESREKTPPMRSYVGEDYEKHGILFVGINYNADDLAKLAIPEKEIFGYAKTYISGNSKTNESIYIDGIVHLITKKIVNQDSFIPTDTAKFFAFTNIVKCSVFKKAGEPTTIMRTNCTSKKGYVFQEIEILRPKFVICIGLPPFNVMKSRFANTGPVEKGFQDWFFRFENQGNRCCVFRILNPPQGYIHIHSEWKKIDKDKGQLSEKWRKFFPDYNSEKEMIYKLNNKSFNKTILKNPLYEQVVDRLIEMARA